MSTMAGSSWSRVWALATIGLAVAVLIVTLAACGSSDPTMQAEPVPAAQSTAHDGPATVTVAIWRTTLSVPEDLRVRVDTRIESGFVLDGPNPGEMLGDFTVLELTASPPRLADDGSIHRSYLMLLEPFLAGDYEIPPMKLAYRSLEGHSAGTIRSEPITIRVTSVLDDELVAGGLDVGGQRDVLDLPEPEPFPWNTVALIFIIGFVTLALSMSLFLVRHRLRREQTVFDGAEDRLDELDDAEYDDPALQSAVVAEVASLVRLCIAERLDPLALQRTTRELAAGSNDWFGLTQDDRFALRTLLERLDRMNYAGGTADASDIHSMLDDTRSVLGRLRSVSSMVNRDGVTGVSG